MSDENIIDLETGYKEVHDNGVGPFLDFIEKNERQFFKAKDFVNLYE